MALKDFPDMCTQRLTERTKGLNAYFPLQA